jgi:hypothetical protein
VGVKRRPKLRLIPKGEVGSASIFDDMTKLRADLTDGIPDAATISVAGKAGKRPAMPTREPQTFAPIPHDYAVELYRHNVGGAAWSVLIELHRMIFAARGRNPVGFWSPRLRAAGLTARTRARALRQLEAAGVIEVEWRGPGLSPQVRHLRYPRRE